jgi:hypothetical protein
MGRFGGPGQAPTLKGVPSNDYTLAPGQVSTVFPAGDWYAHIGRYTTLQQQDPITNLWRGIGAGPTDGTVRKILSNGVNYRFANQTGCVVGALLTVAGSGYTSSPLVTASAGNSIWQSFVGGAVNTSVVISNAGVNYTYPPQVQFSAPPSVANNGIGGIQATGYATLSSGRVASVVVTNQGAGYVSAPLITFVNDPREGQNGVVAGYNAAAVCVLTGAGTVTGVVCIDHGSDGLTSVPTLTISGGGGSSAAATAIMCWSIITFTPTAGTGFTGPSELSALDAFPTTTPAYVNPSTQSALVSTRKASILMPESGGAPTATGAVFYDRGVYTSVPTALVTGNGALITETATFAFTMGGVADTSYIQQM